jgi:EmrB/QacA subfamily drug resistance transporter
MKKKVVEIKKISEKTLMEEQTMASHSVQSEAMSNHEGKTKLQKWSPLVVLALAVAIIVIDGTVLNVSQKAIIQDLNTDIQTIQWAFTSYSLVIAALTVFGGRLGDIFGRKRMFISGALVFAIGSLMTALAQNSGVLIAGWSIVEGIGAALMLPASSALVVSNYSGKDRGVAFGIYGATAGAASAFGPILGGFLSSYSWRLAFGINVFVVAALVLGSMIVKDFAISKNAKRPYLDLPGSALLGAGLTSLVYGIIESTTYGWWTAKKAWEAFGSSFTLPANLSITPFALTLGAILIGLFIRWEFAVEKRGQEPMIRLEIFNNAQFSFGIALLAALFGGFTGVITYGVVFFFLTVKSFTSLQAGLALIPFSIATFIMAPLSARFSQRFGSKVVIQVGILLNLLGSYLTILQVRPEANVQDFIFPFLVFGSGFGLVVAQITNVILSSVPVSLAGVASGINGTAREVARAFGTAIIGAAFIAQVSSSAVGFIKDNSVISQPTKDRLTESFSKGDQNFVVNTTRSDDQIEKEFAAPISQIAANLQKNPQISPIQAQKIALSNFIVTYRNDETEIQNVIKSAISKGSQTALAYTFIFTIVAFFASFGLPNSKKEKLS